MSTDAPTIQAVNKIPRTAAILGVSPTTVKRFIGTGQLRAVKIGRLTAVTGTEIERFLAALNESGSVKTGREAS